MNYKILKHTNACRRVATWIPHHDRHASAYFVLQKNNIENIAELTYGINELWDLRIRKTKVTSKGTGLEVQRETMGPFKFG
jgi:hypothetical protein